MAQNYQQFSRRRKLVYFGVIIVLSFVMVGARQFVDRQAYRNDLQEVDLGNVDLGGSMARYALVSFRGPLLCGLWWEAVERQAKHDWSQLRLLIQTITKLQPHFKQPWIYQAWNLAYNVSVEFDRIEDKYFFIAEGSQLLVEGEKQNRAKVFDPDNPRGKREVPDPEMCWSTGFYQQQKVNVSDEAAYYRILMQLSCIHPDKWDPDGLRQDPLRLSEFKRAYPRLVQRVRELRRIPAGAEDRLNREMLAFFEIYRKIPSLYAGAAPQAGREGRQDFELTATRFPLWADNRAPANPELEAVQDIYEVSRTWYERGNDALPPPNETAGEPVSLPRDERRYRMPQRMFSLLYRCWPAKARSHQAMNLDKEGWTKESLLVWDDAWRRWKQFGRQNGVDMDLPKMRELQQRSLLYRERFPQLAQSALPPPASRVQTEPELQRSFEAFVELIWHGRHRSVTNYDHWEPHSNVHRDPRAAKATEHIYRAENRYRADLDAARQEYEAGMEIWKLFLVELRPDFLLAVGPAWNWGACVNQPNQLLQRTAFGNNRQSQEDLGESHARYQLIRARLEAPWMTLALLFRDRMQLITYASDAPVAVLAVLRALPDNLTPREVELVELVLATRPGPLQGFLLPEITDRPEARPQFQEMPGKPPVPVKVQPPTQEKPK